MLGRHALFAGPAPCRFDVVESLEKARTPGSLVLLKEVWRNPTSEKSATSPGEPTPRLWAALALATAGELELLADIKAEAPKLDGPDRLAAELALAWLGEAVALRPEHFKNESYALGYAAIRLVEKRGGSQGLDMLVSAGLEHPWALVKDEAELAVERIVGKTWPEDGRREAIREWWKKDGSAFVEAQRRKQAEKKQSRRGHHSSLPFGPDSPLWPRVNRGTGERHGLPFMAALARNSHTPGRMSWHGSTRGCAAWGELKPTTVLWILLT